MIPELEFGDSDVLDEPGRRGLAQGRHDRGRRLQPGPRLG